jgi:two-component system NtrC family sensor kinase
LLEFARQSEPKPSPTDINMEIDEVLNILNPELKDTKISTDLKPLPQIKADSGQIRQVIMNILTNSIQSIKTKGEIIVKTRINRVV